MKLNAHAAKKKDFKSTCSYLGILFNVLEVTERGCKVSKIIEKLKVIKNCINKDIMRTRIAWFKSNLLLNIQMYNMSSLQKYIKTI